MKKALFYLIIFLALQMVVPTLVAVAWKAIYGCRPDSADGVWLTISTLIYTLIGITLFFSLHWTPFHGRYIRLRPWSVVLWSLVAGFGLLIPSQWISEHAPALDDIIEEALRNLMDTRGSYLAIAILAPLAEEVVFRGAILRALLASMGHKHWLAIALSAALFAAVHLNPAQMPHAFAVGLLLGWMYYRTRSIIPSTVLHIANNTGAYLSYHLYPNAETLPQIFGSEQAALKAAFFSLLIFIPAVWQLHRLMKKPAEDAPTTNALHQA